MNAALIALVVLGAAPRDGNEPPIDDGALIVDAPVTTRRSAWSWSARALVLIAGDLAHEGDEDTLELVLQPSLALRYEPTPRWDVALSARLRGHLALASSRTRSEVVPDIIEARVSWRPGPELELGWLSDVRWPELVSPHPRDLSLGPRPPTGDPNDRQRAIPALHVAHSAGPLRLELLWQVVAVPMRVPLSGSDWAPIVIAGERDVADRAHPEGLDGGSLGARARVRDGDFELGLSWLWRLDPVPTARGFERQHRGTIDLRLVTGALRWRAEIAAIDQQSAWTRDLTNARAPWLEAIVSLSAAPVIMLDFELGLDAVHAFGADARYLGRGPDDVDVFLRLGLLLAYDGVVRLDLEGRLACMRQDGDLLAALVVRASPRDEIALGLSLFGGNAVAAGLGALYDADDALWVRWIRSL